jgi:glucosamine-6-phosphate deaminase
MTSMNVAIYPSADAANAAAAALLEQWLIEPGVRNVMLAAGNTPLELYRRISERGLRLDHLHLFALDEYVGVPLEEPRNCANLIRRSATQPWGIPDKQYFTISSLAAEAEASVQAHQQRIESAGGLDVIVLGLGQNGHLGFNEPGSAENSTARVLALDRISIEANRKWFGGDYAPSQGATVGMQTILAARRVLLMAYGPHKRDAVSGMLEGPRTERCPASLLQGHHAVYIFLDDTAAAGLKKAK